MGMVISLERNSLYPYVGDRFVASYRWVANHRYGFLERNRLYFRNSLYPYVGDWFVASHRWVANPRYGFLLERNGLYFRNSLYPYVGGSVCREPHVGREPRVWFSFDCFTPIYPYVGDWSVASHMRVANHRYGYPLESNIPQWCGSVVELYVRYDPFNYTYY